MRSIIIKEYINNKFKQKYIKEMSTISENFTRNIFNKSAQYLFNNIFSYI